MTRLISVVYVAAEEDEPLRKKLETYLALLEQQIPRDVQRGCGKETM